MSREPNDFIRSLQELITNSATDQIRASRQFNDLVQSIARGDVDDREANERVNEFLMQATSRYINDLSHITISFFQALRTVNRHYSDHFFDHVMGNNGAPDNGTLRRIDMPLQGAVGDDIERSFVIENRQDEAYDVSFAVSDFTDSKTGAVFRPPLQLQPARFTLRPGDEQVVTLQLPLLDEFFQAGRQYQSTILVRGYDNLMLLLHVDVLDATSVVREPDDLTAVKGIGGKYAAALNKAGVTTYAQLAQIDDETLADVLGNAAVAQSQRYKWHQQARALMKNTKA